MHWLQHSPLGQGADGSGFLTQVQGDSAVGKESRGLGVPGAESAPELLWETMFGRRETQHGTVVEHNLEQPGSEPALARAGSCGSCHPWGPSAAIPGDPRLPQTPAQAPAAALGCQSRAQHLQRRPAVPSRGSRSHCSPAANGAGPGRSLLPGGWRKGVRNCPKPTHTAEVGTVPKAWHSLSKQLPCAGLPSPHAAPETQVTPPQPPQDPSPNLQGRSPLQPTHPNPPPTGAGEQGPSKKPNPSISGRRLAAGVGSFGGVLSHLQGLWGRSSGTGTALSSPSSESRGALALRVVTLHSGGATRGAPLLPTQLQLPREPLPEPGARLGRW